MTAIPAFPFDPELLNRLLGLAQQSSAVADPPEADARAAFAARQANMAAVTGALRASAEAGQAAFGQLLATAEQALTDRTADPAVTVTDLTAHIQAANDAAWKAALDGLGGKNPGEQPG